jgi:hypothetical protein
LKADLKEKEKVKLPIIASSVLVQERDSADVMKEKGKETVTNNEIVENIDRLTKEVRALFRWTQYYNCRCVFILCFIFLYLFYLDGCYTRGEGRNEAQDS